MTELRLLAMALLLGAILPRSAAAQDPGGSPEVVPVTHGQFSDILRKDSGSVVVVNAWATWCKPCTEEMPGVLELGRRHQADRFRLILLSADDPDSLEQGVKPFLRKQGVTFPTYIMNDSSDDSFIVAMNPKWSGALPATFFYDERGSLVKMLVGEHTLAQLEREVAALLRGGG